MALTRICPKCENKGMICVRYRDGSVFDIALCDCRQGMAVRQFSDAEIRTRFVDIWPETQIANLEDFADETTPPTHDVTDAGKRPLRTRL